MVSSSLVDLPRPGSDRPLHDEHPYLRHPGQPLQDHWGCARGSGRHNYDDLDTGHILEIISRYLLIFLSGLPTVLRHGPPQ